MSLLERLARDKYLRDDLLELIKELQVEEPVDPPLAPVRQAQPGAKKQKSNRVAFEDQPMKDVEIQFARAVIDPPNVQLMYAKGRERWTE